MKKTLLFISAALTISTANAQYFSDDFEGGTLTANHAWTTQVVANPDAINGNWVLGTVSGNYAKLGNFVSSANHVLNSWFISPVINLSTATMPVMKFNNTKRYAGDDMIVWISSNYDGTSAPSTATWTDITSLFTLNSDIASWAFTGSGDGDITPYKSATNYIAFEYIGTAVDGSTWEVDDIVIQEGPTVTNMTSIYDIQYTVATNGDSPELGNIVTTKGVVTGVYLFGASTIDRFFIQDGDGAWNGIYVYENGYTVAIGDSVTVTGEVVEFNGLTELSFVSDVTILNSGNTLPTPAVVTNATVGNEEFEGVLVKLADAICITSPDTYGAWTANDGSASAVKIDDDLLPSTFNAVQGNGYDITGIRHFAFSENLIYPTDANDIVTVGWAGLESNSTEFSIYPNPATDFVTINAAPNAQVAIYSVSGALVYAANGSTVVDVSNFEAGIYQVSISTENETTTQKLVVR